MEMSEELKLVDIDKLVPYARNSRTHSPEQIKQIQASIREFGFVNPVLIDGKFNIIAGHGRVLAAKTEGLKEVPCVLVEHLTEAQKKAYILADNKLALNAGWDTEMLKIEIGELKELNFDIGLIGFDGDEIDLIFKQEEEVEEDDFDVDQALSEIVEPTTKRGDIWQLGKHRVMCGDATIQADINKLMGGELADMIFTDPPYNVNYGDKAKMLGNYNKGHRNTSKILNDNMSNDKFYQFLYDSYVSMYGAVKPGGAIYVCHSDTEGINFRQAMKDAGWELKQCIIWVKNALVLGRQDHHWQHEPILYGWKPGEAHRWYGGRNKTTVIKSEDGVFINKTETGFQLTFNNGHQKVVLDVPEYEIKEVLSDDITTTWHIDKPLRSGEHPTMKPIKLCARAIENSSKSGDIVVDLFGGSGSTLIACEQTSRICYTSELDEKYCDVIVKRYEEYTGQKAELI